MLGAGKQIQCHHLVLVEPGQPRLEAGEDHRIGETILHHIQRVQQIAHKIMRIQRLALVDERRNAVLLENARDQWKIHLRLIRRDVDIAITQPFLAHKLAQSAREIGDLRLRLRRLPELHLLAALRSLRIVAKQLLRQRLGVSEHRAARVHRLHSKRDPCPHERFVEAVGRMAGGMQRPPAPRVREHLRRHHQRHRQLCAPRLQRLQHRQLRLAQRMKTVDIDRQPVEPVRLADLFCQQRQPRFVVQSALAERFFISRQQLFHIRQLRRQQRRHIRACAKLRHSERIHAQTAKFAQRFHKLRRRAALVPALAQDRQPFP